MPFKPIVQPTEEEKNRFRPCMSHEHNFPTMIYIPPGETRTWVCPACGKGTTVTQPMILC